MSKKELNELYKRLEDKAEEIASYLPKTDGKKNKCSYQSGNYTLEAHTFVPFSYPIPVFTLPGLGRIEVHPEQVVFSAKIKRKDALVMDYSLLSDYDFAAFDKESFPEVFYAKKDSFLEEMLIRLEKSQAKELVFVFSFGFEVTKEELLPFLKLVKSLGFKY
jgi:hypothetical protein